MSHKININIHICLQAKNWIQIKHSFVALMLDWRHDTTARWYYCKILLIHKTSRTCQHEWQYRASFCLLNIPLFARHNNEKTFLIWINEEDHTRVISMEKGGNMKSVFERFCRGLKQVKPHVLYTFNNQSTYLELSYKVNVFHLLAASLLNR